MPRAAGRSGSPGGRREPTEPTSGNGGRQYAAHVSEAHALETPPGGIAVPPGGWTIDQLDTWPESHIRYELTDGALTLSPSPSSLHQIVSGRLFGRLEQFVPDDLVVTQAVEIRLARQLTRIPDVLVVRSDEPARHWFAPAEVLLAVEIESPGSHAEDRVMKPALYARHGIQVERVITDNGSPYKSSAHAALLARRAGAHPRAGVPAGVGRDLPRGGEQRRAADGGGAVPRRRRPHRPPAPLGPLTAHRSHAV